MGPTGQLRPGRRPGLPGIPRQLVGCAWANDCRPTAAREPGDPAPIWFSQGRDKITVVCELGAYYKVERETWTAGLPPPRSTPSTPSRPPAPFGIDRTPAVRPGDHIRHVRWGAGCGRQGCRGYFAACACRCGR
ncbi:hypothetical protein ACFPM0_28000 [Pseudonocardia sulfidoxydans]|uniref:hypothetical protein n=1 Tax=Pseudonocardia sulfidoxydans TaxID=54011 RepID=UPI0036083FDD